MARCGCAPCCKSSSDLNADTDRQIFFTGIALSYYNQLVKGTLPTNTNASIPLQNYGNNPYANNPPPPNNQWGQPPTGQQSWMVPPYPGPPPGQSQNSYEKGDFQPVAEWANNNTLNNNAYAPPPGPPPQQGFGGGLNRSNQTDAQEEAWERARNQGVTAHLTGHGLDRTRRDSDEGYVVTNREEDEAWERARGEGITAHLTGHQQKRKDGDVV